MNPLARKGYAVKRCNVLDFAVRFVMHDGDVGGVLSGKFGVGKEFRPDIWITSQSIFCSGSLISWEKKIRWP